MSSRSILAALFAASLVILATAPAIHALERAGSSAAVRGQVARANDEHPVGLQIASGEPIFLADRISSGAESGMQIMLLDQTTFTIGPDSFVKIDEFVYDPTTNVGKVTATLGKGVFRFVTGKIAQTNPSSMTVKLPVATIGIRGTMVYGESTENRAVVVLSGAGPDNNTHDKPAAIDVMTPEGTAQIRRPGWGAIVERGRPPVAQRVPKPTVDSIIDRIAPRDVVALASTVGAAQQAAARASQTQQPASGKKVSAKTADDNAGQSSASAAPSVQTFNVAQSQDPSNNQFIISAGQTGSGSSSSSSQFQSGSGFIPTQFADLRTVTSGTGTFTDSNVPILLNSTGPQVGSYNLRLTINFGSQSIVGSFVIVTTGLTGNNANGSVNINQSYANLSGFALVSNGAACGTGVFCGAAADFANIGSTIAKEVFHAASVSNGTQSATGTHNVFR